MEVKKIRIFQLNFQASSENEIKKSIAYRYNNQVGLLKHMQQSAKDVNGIINTSNPSLLLKM